MNEIINTQRNKNKNAVYIGGKHSADINCGIILLYIGGKHSADINCGIILLYIQVENIQLISTVELYYNFKMAQKTKWKKKLKYV